MQIQVKHYPQEHWGFRTPRGMLWISSWGRVSEFSNYYCRKYNKGCVFAHRELRMTLNKVFNSGAY